MDAGTSHPAGVLQDRTKQLALRVIRMVERLPATEAARTIGRQVLRSATSVAANYRAACRARSRAAFRAKLGVVVEEADETVFWLEILAESGIVRADRLSRLTGEASEVRSIMVGEGPQRAQVESRLARSTGKLVTYIPHLERERMTEVYAASDVLVLTSAVEGLPFAVLEALAMGCPVAATKVGDIARIVRHGDNGFLVEADEPERLARFLARLASDAKQRASMRSAAARSMAESGLTRSAMLRGYERLLGELTGS